MFVTILIYTTQNSLSTESTYFEYMLNKQLNKGNYEDQKSKHPSNHV